jgi:hypothetical protein
VTFPLTFSNIALSSLCFWPTEFTLSKHPKPFQRYVFITLNRHLHGTSCHIK